MIEKETFIFHLSWMEAFADFPTDVRCEILDTIIAYAKNRTVPNLSPVAKMAFKFIKKDMDYDIRCYELTCERNRENGRKGGRPKKQENPAVFEETQQNPKKPSGFSENPTEPKKPQNNINVDNNNGSSKEDIVIIKEKPKKEKAFEGYSEDWIKLFNEWLEYKAAKKQGYKSEKSLRAMADQLYKLASGDIETARLIVNQSLANNWNGLFQLKTVKPSESDHYKGDDTIGKVFERRGID